MTFLKIILKRFIGLLTIYTILRGYFIFQNISIFPEISISNYFTIFTQGIRYDITALLYLNSIFILLHFLPVKLLLNKLFNKFLLLLFISTNLFGIIISLIDVAFYKFNSKRIDAEVLGMKGTIPLMIGSFLKDYWYLLIIFILLVYLVFKLYNSTNVFVLSEKKVLFKKTISFIFLCGLITLGLRGGIQYRPIKPAFASSLIKMELAPLITNSPFTFLFSLSKRSLKEKKYFTQNQLDQLFPIKQSISPSLNITDNVNVVYIILESFSAEFVGYLNNGKGHTPNLDKISKQSLTFTNAFANGRRSSQGLVALTLGFPSLMDEPFMHSLYLNNNIYALPRLLNKKGYHNSFFNGSGKKMLAWEEYIGQAGFDNYYSKESYPNSAHDDGHWGIYDHYFLNYFKEKLSTFQEPFFSTFFSISSHHPYLIPDSLENEFGDAGTFLSSLKYTDWALGEFFKNAQEEPWFDNTVFIITADHTNGAAWKLPGDKNSTSTNSVGIYKIPILIYSPKWIKPDTLHKPIQQLDLFNTVLDLVNYQGEFYSFGKSVLSFNDNLVFQYVSGVYQLIKGDYILLFSDEKSFFLYNYKNDPELSNNLLHTKSVVLKSMEKMIKAIIQRYQVTLSSNSMKLDI